MRTALALPLAAALAGCSVSEPPAPPPPQAQPQAELMKWPALLERERPEPDATIAYGDDQMQKADLWLPAGPGPHPIVLMVHGGCWQTEIADRRIMSWIADDLRKRGIAVWNVDYRGVDRAGGGYPGTFRDVAAAADALRGQAERYRLALHPLVAVGHSAGGHLALWLAARAQWHDGPLVVRFARSGRRPAQIDSETLRLETALHKVPGVDVLRSIVRPDGTSETRVSFRADADLRSALREARAQAVRAVPDASVATLDHYLPRNSPIGSGEPLPIAAVVSLGGLPDLELAATPPGSGCGTEVIKRLVGPPTLSSRHVYGDTSVPRLLPLGIRQVLINGTQDRIIPVHYATDYEAKARAAGDAVKVRMLERTGHVELIAPETAAWAAAVEEIEAALRRKG
jgi:acetyl esterase/lipase